MKPMTFVGQPRPVGAKAVTLSGKEARDVSVPHERRLLGKRIARLGTDRVEETQIELPRVLRVHGEETKYHHKVVGINSRLDALQAAVLRAKLPHLDEWTRARQRKAQQYELMFIDAGLAEQIEVPFVKV